MYRTFVLTAEFDKQWRSMNLTDDDLRALEEEILENPKIGVVMKGTGRLRKMRFAFEGRGKSRSIRVTYVDFVNYATVYLIYAYPKSEKDNLSKEERNEIKKLIEGIEKALDRRYLYERI
ncbi:type II toxin-antitoxin system RelE/ParE family toxin [Lutispora saccharofermentans]|uniref:Type II toxin-antitoxin system RelE/ParE family toxin n=1 Tax=Lutispora saccharofermentans TaxID=3024236 RepID=A0ABT1NE45_9FIRM|nr:type II toxin-antitoxin system RelE/ParE family toxin [Lutispora saccharofermentans]MCQ1529529.1 type II toxin-antitoxin system RelE/ParE family toxin [Lutispora saccharofermentans]